MKPPISAVHKGSAFETRALTILQRDLSMSLCRVGGRSDGGIDLQGWWWLPLNLRSGSTPIIISDRHRIRVLGQCKAERKKIGPKYIREMEGVLHRFPQQDNPSIALFISESPFSKETLLRAHSSTIPFFLLHLPPQNGPEYTTEVEHPPRGIGSIIWNPTLGGANGLLGGQVEARWEHPVQGADIGRPGLWIQNRRISSWIPDGG